MHVEVSAELPVELTQEMEKLLVAVAWQTAAEDFAMQQVKRGEEGGGAVALVVMRHGGGPAAIHWQDGGQGRWATCGKASAPNEHGLTAHGETSSDRPIGLTLGSQEDD